MTAYWVSLPSGTRVQVMLQVFPEAPGALLDRCAWGIFPELGACPGS